MFNRHGPKRGGRPIAECKTCRGIYRHRYYRDNKPKVMALVRAGKRRNMEALWAIKSEAKCTDCLKSFPDEPWIMEYDHLHSKVGGVGELAKRGMRLAIEEIVKCEPVCVLCHRRRTAKRAGWKFIPTVTRVA